jgi:predicted transcriptional regulator
MATKGSTKPKAARKGKGKVPARTGGKGKRRPKVDPKRSAAAKKAAETRARNAAERAKEAGATGTGQRLAAAEQQLRDAAILACLDAGWTQEEVAAELECTDRTVRNAIERSKRSRSPLEGRPVELVEQRLRALARAEQSYRVFAWANSERNPSVALGAMKAADAVAAQLDEMLIAIGKLPEDLALLRAQAEMERVQSEMVRCMREVESGERTPAEAVAFFEGLIESPEDELARLTAVRDDGEGSGASA